MAASRLAVEVVYAAATRQVLKTVQLAPGGCVRDAIQASGLLGEFPEIDLQVNRVGVYGELVDLDTPLTGGERVEIYRKLIADPKEARRRRAGAKPKS